MSYNDLGLGSMVLKILDIDGCLGILALYFLGFVQSITLNWLLGGLPIVQTFNI
jgi:hypothetical protein